MDNNFDKFVVEWFRTKNQLGSIVSSLRTMLQDKNFDDYSRRIYLLFVETKFENVKMDSYFMDVVRAPFKTHLEVIRCEKINYIIYLILLLHFDFI